MQRTLLRCMTRLSAVALAAALSTSAIPAAWSQLTRVAQIEVEGNKSIAGGTILARISTRPGDELSQARLDQDVQAIRAMGWFRAVAPPRVEDTPTGKRVTFVVTEWPVVQKIEFSGNTVFDRAALLGVLATKESQVFNLLFMEADIEKIQDLYRQRGYHGQVTAGAGEGFPETGILRIPIQQTTVAEVRIRGLRWTRETAIRRVLRQTPGKLYNTHALQQDLRRLRRLERFESISVKAEAAEFGKVVVTWTVKERPAVAR